MNAPGEIRGGATRCQGCRDEIAFVTTARGKAHPVNGLEPERYYIREHVSGHPQVRIILRGSGELLSGLKVDEHTSGALAVDGWESHFATCSEARQFSGRGR